MSISRRNFVKMGVTGIAAAPIVGCKEMPAVSAEKQAITATLPYPSTSIGKAATFSDNVPVSFSFPDASSPCVIIKMGKPTPGGVGPDNDLVAYSTMCTHMGCPVSYDAAERTFKCPCHYTLFDAELSGQMVCGHATEDLPQIVLEYDSKNDTVHAVGVNGKIYGRQTNVL